MKTFACFGLLVTSFCLMAQVPDRPSTGMLTEFWIISAADLHNYPYWSSLILHATEEKGGTRVRYFLIDGAELPCNQPDIRAAEVLLLGKRIGNITHGVELCSLDPERITTAVSQARREPKLFESSRLSITAKCGSVRKSF